MYTISYFDWPAIRAAFLKRECRFGYVVALLVTVMLALLIGNAT